MSDETNSWSLDKHVPVALIITMMLQTVAVITVGTAWVTNTNNRLVVIEEYIRTNGNIGTKLALIEERQNRISEDVTEIKQRLR